MFTPPWQTLYQVVSFEFSKPTQVIIFARGKEKCNNNNSNINNDNNYHKENSHLGRLFSITTFRMSLWIHGRRRAAWCLSGILSGTILLYFWADHFLPVCPLCNLSVCQGSAVCMIWIWYRRYRWWYVLCICMYFSFCFRFDSFFYCFLTLNDCHSILSLNFQIIKCINTQSCFILSIIKQTYVVFNTVTRCSRCLCSHRILNAQMHCKIWLQRQRCSCNLFHVESFFPSIHLCLSFHDCSFSGSSFSLPQEASHLCRVKWTSTSPISFKCG